MYDDLIQNFLEKVSNFLSHVFEFYIIPVGWDCSAVPLGNEGIPLAHPPSREKYW